MVCFMETISRDVEPLQFSVITIFHGKATGVINNVWVIVTLKSSYYNVEEHGGSLVSEHHKIHKLTFVCIHRSLDTVQELSRNGLESPSHKNL